MNSGFSIDCDTKIAVSLSPRLAVHNGNFSAHLLRVSDLKVAEGNGKLQSN